MYRPKEEKKKTSHTQIKYLRLFHYIYIFFFFQMCCCPDSFLGVCSMAQRDVVKWTHIPLLFVPSIYCNCKSPSIVKPNYFKLNLFTFVSHLFVVYIVWLWHNVDRTKYHKKKRINKMCIRGRRSSMFFECVMHISALLQQ